MSKPEILAPAGDKTSFLAALDAGADSIYCGLKIFSARMQAENFSLQELSALSKMARDRGCKVFVALNSLLKPDELDQAADLLHRLALQVQPQGLILQDLALLELARQTGLQADLQLSTLAACNSPRALQGLRTDLGLRRIVLPRELTLDEIKLIAESCPGGLGLEVFVHGALCYAVSGRCYWSSYLGGKSSLRGRCVQPCRRIYNTSQGQGRFFSCLDLSLDVLSKTLLQIPQIKAWKIEGRKKGAHYVYYTVKAYKLFRDHPDDPAAKKTALLLLQDCLGRKGSHYFFLPQRPHFPFGQQQENCSGLFIGLTDKKGQGRSSLRTRRELLPGDLLRIGVQDQPGHHLYRLTSFTGQGKKLHLPKEWKNVQSRTPVFLVDRQEHQLRQRLQQLNKQLAQIEPQERDLPAVRAKLPAIHTGQREAQTMHVLPASPQGKVQGLLGLWLKPSLFSSLKSRNLAKYYFWLPPVIWPQEENAWTELVSRALSCGAWYFVLNAPWQTALFPEDQSLMFWAGPFCNLSNALALQIIKQMGFFGAFASPELNKTGLLELAGQSPLPLGMIIQGFWPFCISRTLHPELKPGTVLHSPKNETSWIKKSGSNYYHYPNWELNLSSYQTELSQAGFSLFAMLRSSKPGRLPWRKRDSDFNWNLELI